MPSLTEICAHEAGHLVGCMALGIRFGGAYVYGDDAQVYNRTKGQWMSGFVACDADSHRDPSAVCVMTAMGPAAQQLLCGTAGGFPRGEGQDFEDFMLDVSRCVSGGTNSEYAGNRRRFIQACYAKADELLRDHRRQLEALARALESRRLLDAGEAWQIWRATRWTIPNCSWASPG